MAIRIPLNLASVLLLYKSILMQCINICRVEKRFVMCISLAVLWHWSPNPGPHPGLCSLSLVVADPNIHPGWRSSSAVIPFTGGRDPCAQLTSDHLHWWKRRHGHSCKLIIYTGGWEPGTQVCSDPLHWWWQISIWAQLTQSQPYPGHVSFNTPLFPHTQVSQQIV